MFGRLKHRQRMPDPQDPHQAQVILQFDQPIKRSRLASRWNARAAVRRQMSQQEYLQWRLACYQSHAPQQRHPLPFAVSIAQGEVVRTPNPESDIHPWRRLLEDPAGEDTFEAAVVRAIRFLNQSESQMVLRDLQQHEEDVSRLTACLLEVSEALEDLAVAQQREIAAGTSPVPATLARARRSRGRPQRPVPWFSVACALVITVTVLVEAFQFALPYLNATGVDIANLAGEWHRNRIGLLAGGGFALAASAGIFILWSWVIQTTVALFRCLGAEPWWKTALQAVVPLVLGGLLVATAAGLGLSGLTGGWKFFRIVPPVHPDIASIPSCKNGPV